MTDQHAARAPGVAGDRVAQTPAPDDVPQDAVMRSRVPYDGLVRMMGRVMSKGAWR
ncbi:hypothetical protein [Vannielia litorea]|nr:hypothetical protein [Vannielia litorea]